MFYEYNEPPTTNTTPFPWRTTPALAAQKAAARLAARAATQMAEREAERKAQCLVQPTRFELELPDSTSILVVFTDDCRSPALRDAMEITRLLVRISLGLDEECDS